MSIKFRDWLIPFRIRKMLEYTRFGSPDTGPKILLPPFFSLLFKSPWSSSEHSKTIPSRRCRCINQSNHEFHNRPYISQRKRRSPAESESSSLRTILHRNAILQPLVFAIDYSWWSHSAQVNFDLSNTHMEGRHSAKWIDRTKLDSYEADVKKIDYGGGLYKNSGLRPYSIFPLNV